MRSSIERGCPYHLLNGTMSFGATADFLQDQSAFLMSPLYCGGPQVGYVKTTDYCGGAMTLSDAMAISGAAISPFQLSDPIGKAILTLANFRLGSWLPNPGRFDWQTERKQLPPVMKFLLELWASYPQTAGRIGLQWCLWQWFLPSHRTPFVFVGDGAFYENLGLEELLRRRCRLMISVDAGHDPQYRFDDLRVLSHRLANSIRIEPLFSQNELGLPVTNCLIPGLSPSAESGWARSHFEVMKVTYLSDGIQPSSVGYVIYVKLNMTGDEDLGLRAYRVSDPEFPHDPTSDQLFEDSRFEAYRRLGYHVGNELADYLQRSRSDDSRFDFWLGRWNPDTVDRIEPVKPDWIESEEFSNNARIAMSPSEESWRRVFAIRELSDHSPRIVIPMLMTLTHANDADVAAAATQMLQDVTAENISLTCENLLSSQPKRRTDWIDILAQTLNRLVSRSQVLSDSDVKRLISTLVAIESLLEQVSGQQRPRHLDSLITCLSPVSFLVNSPEQRQELRLLITRLSHRQLSQEIQTILQEVMSRLQANPTSTSRQEYTWEVF